MFRASSGTAGKSPQQWAIAPVRFIREVNGNDAWAMALFFDKDRLSQVKVDRAATATARCSRR